jgi:hypothetical protein
MQRKRIAALAAAGVVAAAGTGVAVATTRTDDAKQREQAVLDDAAKRLGVEPAQLRDALGKAVDDQIDAAVKAGKLTQEQADAIKQRRADSGLVLGGGPPGPGFERHGFRGGPGFGPGGPGFGHGGPGAVFDAAAKAVGLTRAQLFEKLRSGKSLQAIAKAQGKDYVKVKAAVRDAVKADLDQAVKDKRLTQQQADELLGHLTEHLDDGFFGGRGRHDGPPPGMPPMPPGP